MEAWFWTKKMKINIKKLTNTARIPERGSDCAAGYDLFADLGVDLEVPPRETVMIPTGLAIEIPEGYFGGVFARSGLASKEMLRPANCVGVIDSDYRGEMRVPLHNDSDMVRRVTPGQKVAQLIVIPFLELDFCEADSLGRTQRGTAGFGSTGR